MAQDFDFTGVLGKQAHSKLRNCFSSTSVESKNQPDSGIIESLLLSKKHYLQETISLFVSAHPHFSKGKVNNCVFLDSFIKNTEYLKNRYSVYF